LAGKRVLDIGCNAGLYDLRMVEASAREVVGIDLDARVRQAEFVREWFAQKGGRDYSRVCFIAADVTNFDLISLGPFDLTCMFCVAYHLGDGINHIMEQVAQIADTVALQGNTSRLTNPKYRDRPHQHLAGVIGMQELLQSYGFSKIKLFAPEGHPKPLVIGTRPLDIPPSHEVDR
jgi:SAM-dependent methyltransferase